MSLCQEGLIYSHAIPGAPHAAQRHIGHFTFVWLDIENRLFKAYTSGVFLTDTTAAKAVLGCLDIVVGHLVTISAILVSHGYLEKDRCCSFQPALR
eukprot:gene15983-biopygen2863